MFTRLLGDNDALRGHAYYFPFLLRNEQLSTKVHEDQTALGLKGGVLGTRQPPPAPTTGPLITPNGSHDLRNYLENIGLAYTEEAVALAWLHVLAVSYSLMYLADNADGIRQDWPRIPLPNLAAALTESAALGEAASALLDVEHSVDTVTDGTIAPPLRLIGLMQKVDGQPLDETRDLMISAGWGHVGKNGVTMPGRGRSARRERTEAEMGSLVGGSSGFT